MNVMDKGLARLDGCRGSRVRVKTHRIDEARAGGVPDATPLFSGAHPNKIPGREQQEIPQGLTENPPIQTGPCRAREGLGKRAEQILYFL